MAARTNDILQTVLSGQCCTPARIGEIQGSAGCFVCAIPEGLSNPSTARQKKKLLGISKIKIKETPPPLKILFQNKRTPAVMIFSFARPTVNKKSATHSTHLDQCPTLPNHVSLKESPRVRRLLEQLFVESVVKDTDP